MQSISINLRFLVFSFLLPVCLVIFQGCSQSPNKSKQNSEVGYKQTQTKQTPMFISEAMEKDTFNASDYKDQPKYVFKFALAMQFINEGHIDKAEQTLLRLKQSGSVVKKQWGNYGLLHVEYHYGNFKQAKLYLDALNSFLSSNDAQPWLAKAIFNESVYIKLLTGEYENAKQLLATKTNKEISDEAVLFNQKARLLMRANQFKAFQKMYDDNAKYDENRDAIINQMMSKIYMT